MAAADLDADIVANRDAPLNRNNPSSCVKPKGTPIKLSKPSSQVDTVGKNKRKTPSNETGNTDESKKKSRNKKKTKGEEGYDYKLAAKRKADKKN